MANVDANPRDADWLRVVAHAREFAEWTTERIDAECAAAYRAYHADVRARHVAYYVTRPDECSSTHSFIAATREHAFPPAFQHLAGALGDGAWHRHHRSAGSSQVMAIALLAAAREAATTLSWLPGRAMLGRTPLPLFEVELGRDVLNESPRQTSLDFLVLGSAGVVAGEAKFTEKGFGVCSCETYPQCSGRVLARPYWRVAEQELGLRRSRAACTLSLAYQPVRNIAAALAIAGSTRRAVFLTLYDERNPYFAGSGAWPGWTGMLRTLMANGAVDFRDLSWQRLVEHVDAGTRLWAREKHGIVSSDAA